MTVREPATEPRPWFRLATSEPSRFDATPYATSRGFAPSPLPARACACSKASRSISSISSDVVGECDAACSAITNENTSAACFSSLVGTLKLREARSPRACVGLRSLGGSMKSLNYGFVLALSGSLSALVSCGGSSAITAVVDAGSSGDSGLTSSGGATTVGTGGDTSTGTGGDTTVGAGGASTGTGGASTGAGGASTGTGGVSTGAGGAATGGATTGSGGKSAGGAAGAGTAGAAAAGAGGGVTMAPACPNPPTGACTETCVSAGITCRCSAAKMYEGCMGSGAACPAAVPSTMSACPGTLTCPYADGQTCTCAGPNANWRCTEPPLVCPATAPTVGDACVGQGICDYGTAGARRFCTCDADKWACAGAGAGACPAMVPATGDACTGTTTCTYGTGANEVACKCTNLKYACD